MITNALRLSLLRGATSPRFGAAFYSIVSGWQARIWHRRPTACGMERMTYYFNTEAGMFMIVSKHGRWHLIFQHDRLGTYETAEQAVDALASGQAFSLRGRVDTSNLGIPRNINEWSRADERQR